jgi:hypothetical protein
MEGVGIFYGHLVYFIARRYILWPFGIFLAIWYIFSRFGMLYKEKSGNPDFLFLRLHSKKRRNSFVGYKKNTLPSFLGFESKSY